ncbi:carbamoyltransferase family protein [Sphaerisporangium fuscum]|uniref:carbamoyltransferase family protein n=1 Tax=Sphaerisporangium fuscum TaxID=2835868 RepID=UPI001BDC94AD|nr:carbamoyltransferase C-terminal domain-containing protein [Sphaerisporangium fuscum]
MAAPTYVLGTGLSHDGSVCLLADGVIALAIEKERLTRIKHDGGNDRLAMEYVLDRAGITLDEVAVVVQNENFGMFREGNAEYGGSGRLLGDATNVVTISHHLAHAYSAFGGCPFDETAVLVVDGCGNAHEDCLDLAGAHLPTGVPPGLGHLYFEKDSYYAAEGGTLRPVVKDFSPWGAKGWPVTPPSTLHSIGGVYRAFSGYVFGGFDDSGKLMGLAPYGRPGRFDQPIFELEAGRVLVRREALEAFTAPRASRPGLKDDFQYYADLAYWVQREVERALLHLVRDRYERWPSPNLSYAGGVALNAVANSRILRETGFRRLYVQPAAGDNGLAIGCAYYGWLEVLGRERVRHDQSTYFGPRHPAEEVRKAVEAAGGRVRAEQPADVVEETARLLAEGKVVGWYQGGAEFGPRALGHRSILAHPGVPGLRDHINRDIKFREDFRPFAPSVILQEAATYFDCEGHDSPHMILVFDVRPEWREALVNVVHEDGSARLQTVTEQSEPRYFRLLRAFQRRTGLPVLLNTSLNRRGMPIVESPQEALSFFLECGLDALVLGDLLITKTPRPDGPQPRRTPVPLENPGPEDVPLIGRRVTGVALAFQTPDGTGAGLPPSADKVVLTFGDRSDPLELAPDAFKLLSLCDGRRTYADIGAEIPVETGYLLRFAAVLSRHGILDHVAR